MFSASFSATFIATFSAIFTISIEQIAGAPTEPPAGE